MPCSRGQNSNAASLGQSYFSSNSVGSTVTAKSLQLFSLHHFPRASSANDGVQSDEKSLVFLSC